MENDLNKNTQNNPKNSFEDLNSIWKNFNHFITELLDIKKDTDKSGTIQDVKDNISIKGHTAWILVFSILIASIGLNVSSTAVVIGAMLISPLMGPILGIGLSIGINDIDTLKRSFINLGVMIVLSLLTSYIFFSIPIFQDLTPEIKARTAPDVRDVFIAIFGGLALIVALTRRTQQTNTIAGVAIATALMPPLCTAGYGLATGDLNYFLGAMFLFTINTIFIALATFLIVKYLRFPMVKYINSLNRKRVARLASVLALIIFSFSVFQFYKLYKQDEFKENVKTFIEEMKADGISIIDEDEENINFKNKSVKLVLYGKILNETSKKQWETKLKDYTGIFETKLILQQGADNSDLRDKVQNLTDLYAQNQKIITSRDEQIKQSQEKVKLLEHELSKYYRVPFSKVSREAQINYTGLKSISYANLIRTNFKTTDTLTIFTASWYDSIPDTDLQEERLKLWLKTRLDLDSITVIRK